MNYLWRGKMKGSKTRSMHANMNTVTQILTLLRSESWRAMRTLKKKIHSINPKIAPTNLITKDLLRVTSTTKRQYSDSSSVSSIRSYTTSIITLGEVLTFCIIFNVRLHLPVLFRYSVMVWSFRLLAAT